ncbi:MAG: phosphotransferase [Pseudorhodobacter sp.]
MSLEGADRCLVARDPGLPGLALLLDTEALGKRLGGGPLQVDYLRYKPGESCTLRLDDGGAGLIVRAVNARRYADYLHRAVWRRADSPVRYLDEACTVVMPGGLDRKIKMAKTLLDSEAAAEFLAGLIGPGADAPVVLRHKPGRRLVVRIDRGGRPLGLLKAVPPARFAALKAAAERAVMQGGAPILGMDPARGILLQAWVAGEVANAQRDPATYARIGSVLAVLHQLPAPEGAHALHPCGAALYALKQLLPPLAAEADALAAGLAMGLARNPGRIGFYHGDFSADQVVLDKERPHFIDWDRAGPGPVLADLGSFLARLDADRILDGLPSGLAETLGRAFRDGYETVATVPDSAALYHAAALAALVCEPFRRRSSDWPEKSASLLRCAAELAGPHGALARALDRGRMQHAISAAWGREVNLDTPELLRDRPGRRALVAYRGRDAVGRDFETYGKLRIKGLDHKTPALHHYLRGQGLDGEIAVPKAMGVLPGADIWMQERVEGRLLTDLLQPGADTGPARAAGRALARLHAVPPWPATHARMPWSFGDESKVMRDAIDHAAGAHPALCTDLTRIGDDLTAKLRALPQGRPTGIHRDFYPDQVIIAPDRVWLLDLDLFTMGDPAIDLGNFIAHLQEMELRHWGRPGPLEAHGTAFLQGYAREAPLPDPARIDLLTQVSLARHAWIATRLPERSHVIARIIARLAGRGEPIPLNG